jgi:NAD(P)-dependent dehydrogenase (short-subunit alcohol dehydrogenase family)
MRLEGRAAIVTGGSGGIGKGIVLALAEAGADVLVSYNSNREEAAETVREVEALGRRTLVFQADVTDYDQVKSMVAAAVEAFGKIDFLVCNAGIIHRNVGVYDADLNAFHEMIDNHIMGSFHCIQAALPVMRQQPRGDIHLLSTTHTRILPPGLTSYAVAKAGVEALGLCLAKEERGNNIRVNIICPTTVPSGMSEQFPSSIGMSDFDEVGRYMPFGRVVLPKDIGELCAFLASEEGSHISGQVISVDASLGRQSMKEFIPKEAQKRQRSAK